MRKFHVSFRNGDIDLQEMEVEIIHRFPFEYFQPWEHHYKILSGANKGEIWMWWAFSDSKQEAKEKAYKLYAELTEQKLRNFLQMIDLVISDRFGERCKWR